MSLTNSKKVLCSMSLVLFAAYVIWWVYIFLFEPSDSLMRDYFTDTYGILAGLGGFIGFLVAKKWSGMKSYVGKALTFFSIGLLAQFLGQLSYSIEFYLYGIANSYPSWGELFYLTTIPMYSLGVYYISAASGIKFTMNKLGNKIGAVLFPVLMIGISYMFFIRGTDFSEFTLLMNMLNFAYPMGQAFFVSLALLTYFFTDKVLGGVMRKRVVFILIALIFQYAADSTFLYKVIKDTWYPADLADLMFAVSYFLMTSAFLKFLVVLDKLKKTE